jgi:phosphoadenosine phosphosulfate reductase
MERLAATAAVALAGAPAEEVIKWAGQTFGSRLCITSSMTDAVIIDLVSKTCPGMDVVFLDTGYHFAETIGTRDAISSVYPVNVINVTPTRTVAEQDAELGAKLYSRNPDLCCYLRKVVPLEQALEPYDAWITGVRSQETHARSDTKAVQWDPRREMVKVSPIAGARKTLTPTSPTMACWSTRWSTTDTRRSAAGPAPSGSRRALIRAAGGGRAQPRRSAASTSEDRPG